MSPSSDRPATLKDLERLQQGPEAARHTRVLGALLETGFEDLLDHALDTLDCERAEDGTVEGMRQGFLAGLYLGFLRTCGNHNTLRLSYQRLLVRYRHAVERSPMSDVDRHALIEQMRGAGVPI